MSKKKQGLSMGGIIQEARETQRLTRKDFAAKLGVSDQYVYQVESGRRVPTLETLWLFAVALGLDPSSLDHRLAKGIQKKPK